MPSTYIGKVHVESEDLPIGTTLFGVCTTSATTTTKEVVIDGLNTPIKGVFITIKFTQGNTVSSPTLDVADGTIPTSHISAPIEGNAICGAGDVLSFVYESGENNDHKWHVLYGSLRDKAEALSAGGAMHFKGVVSTIPDATSENTFNNYAAGDVILGPDKKEYVYNRGLTAAASSWEPLGDENTGNVVGNVTISDNNSLPTLTFSPAAASPTHPVVLTGVTALSQGETGQIVTDINTTTCNIPQLKANTGTPTILSVRNGVLTVTAGKPAELETGSTVTVFDSTNGAFTKQKFTSSEVEFTQGTRQTLTVTQAEVYMPISSQSSGG